MVHKNTGTKFQCHFKHFLKLLSLEEYFFKFARPDYQTASETD